MSDENKNLPDLPVEAYESIRRDEPFMLQGTLCLFGNHALYFMNTLKYTHEWKDNTLHINRIEDEDEK